MSGRAIHADGLTKYYGNVVGVEDLSFAVEDGEIYGFLGANGAGKTTTIRLLLDLLRPSRGRATVLGFDCRRESLQTRARIGYLPGELPVYPDMTASGYLHHLARLGGSAPDGTRLAALLRRFDVSDIDLRRRLRDQSHGMKQKIGIIQALMGSAPVLILDEPTSGLDPLMVNAFRETVDEIRRGGRTTVFLSSHVLAEVESMCDRIGLVRGGRMVTVSAISDLRRLSPRRVTIDFAAPVGTLPPVDGARVVSSTATQAVIEIQGPLGPLLAAIAPLPVNDLRVDAFRLEDYVLNLYAGEAK